MRNHKIMVISVLCMGCSEYTIGPESDNELFGAADEQIYVNSNDHLWSWDPETDDLVSIGEFFDKEGFFATGPGNQGMTDIAIDQNGRMYGWAFGSLFRIDPETAKLRHIHDFSRGLFGLTFHDGMLLGAGLEVVALDLQMASVEETVVSAANSLDTSGDIVGAPDGRVYWSVVDWEREHKMDRLVDTLIAIEPDSGKIEHVSDLPLEGVWGLGYAHGMLYGFTRQGKILEISLSGDARVVSENPGEEWWGATSNPALW
ncbi:MAG: hypothetical protein AAFV53_24115 [Myxococcota bacterium]